LKIRAEYAEGVDACNRVVTSAHTTAAATTEPSRMAQAWYQRSAPRLEM
jgi:hypothetical protein